MTESRRPDTEPMPGMTGSTACAIMQGSPKKEWRFEKALRKPGPGDQSGGEGSGAEC